MSKLKSFPHKRIGDKLYRFLLDTGLHEYVIVRQNELGFCEVVPVLPYSSKHPVAAFDATEDCWETPEAALRAAAIAEIERQLPRIKFALSAKRAVAKGEDIGPFLNGLNHWTGRE